MKTDPANTADDKKTTNKVDRGATSTFNSKESQIRICKEERVQHDHMLGHWKVWQTRPGVLWGCMEQLKADLAELYEELLKRTFVKTT